MKGVKDWKPKFNIDDGQNIEDRGSGSFSPFYLFVSGKELFIVFNNSPG